MSPAGYRYRAFISYSHADAATARWLHQRLERYRVPSRLVGTQGAHGPVPRRIGRCFRDQAELSAASHLGETLQQSLRDSQVLIVICSPKAAQSPWVNAEIRYFRSLGREHSIYALIVDGEPNAEDPALECFPPALLRAEDGTPHPEPLAADARGHADGRNDALLKLAAGILGVGFDELRQRERQRRTRLTALVVSASLTLAAITTTLAISAYQARNDAQQRRAQADDLINFMLGDLREEMYMVGRIDALDSTVGKAMSYLGSADLPDVEPETLARRSQALSNVSTIRYLRGDQADAKRIALQAVEAARAAQQAAPGPAADEALARAIHALGEPSLEGGDFAVMTPLIQEAREIARKLTLAAPDNPELALLRASIDDHVFYISAAGPTQDLVAGEQAERECIDLLRPVAARPEAEARFVRFFIRCQLQRAVLLMEPGASGIASAAEAFETLLRDGESAEQRFPGDQQLQLLLMGGYSNAANLFIRTNDLDKASRASARSLGIGEKLMAVEPGNMEWRRQLGQAQLMAMAIEQDRGDLEASQRAARGAVDSFDLLLQRNPQDEMARSFAMAVRNRYASQLNKNGETDAALAELAAGLAIRDASGQSQRLLVNELDLRLLQSIARRKHPALAREALAAAVQLHAQLEKQDRVFADNSGHSAMLDYVQGRIAEGDARIGRIKVDKIAEGALQYRKAACEERTRSGQAPCKPRQGP